MHRKGFILALQKVFILYQIKVNTGMHKHLQWIALSLEFEASGTGNQHHQILSKAAVKVAKQVLMQCKKLRTLHR
jgi:hypothetical protein